MKRGCIKHVECLDTASLPFRMDKCGEGEEGRRGEGQNTGTMRSLPLRGGIARFLSVMMFPGHGVELECRTVMRVVGIGIPDSFCRLSACVRLLCWLENSPSGVFFRFPLVLLRRIRSDQFSVQMGDDNLPCISVESDFVETPGLVSSFVRV